MLKRGYKLIICVVLISALFIGFGTCFASAATPVWLLRAKAGVAAAMLAANLVLEPVSVIMDNPLIQAIDPVGKVEWVETFPEYLDKSTIKVVENTAIIDGVEYSDVWLGPDAADALRLQGLDFATAYNIANNQDSPTSYAEGLGYVSGVPVYTVDGHRQSAFYSLYINDFTNPSGTLNGFWEQSSSFYIGDFVGRIGYNSDTTGTVSFRVNNDGTMPTSGSYETYNFQRQNPGYFYVNSANRLYVAPTADYGTGVWVKSGSFVSDPFSFDYTSGIIDAPIDPDDGLLVRVPTSYSDPQTGTVIYDIHDFTVNYPDISQPGGHEIELDPALNPDFETDLDLGNGIGDLLVTIFGIDLLRRLINFAPEPTTPEPGPQPGVIDPLPDPDPAPDDPLPGTTIGETDWVVLDEILRWIQSTIDSIRHITESLQTMLDSLFDQIQTLIQTLQELPQQILDDIETGPSKVFRKAIDILKTIFLPLLLPIRAMMNLWHYVVDWVGSVASPFTWIFGVMSNTSYNLVLPIYASLAGAICIAIYKALGR